MNDIQNSNKGEIVMYQPDETIRLEVRVENDSVWLTQAQMAELFDATKQNISLHIINVYSEGELDELSTVKDYLTVRQEGQRMVKRHVLYYNLDVIISVGYRVKSLSATRFYSSGAYLYVNNRLSEIKWLLFKASTTLA